GRDRFRQRHARLRELATELDQVRRKRIPVDAWLAKRRGRLLQLLEKTTEFTTDDCRVQFVVTVHERVAAQQRIADITEGETLRPLHDVAVARNSDGFICECIADRVEEPTLARELAR